MYTKVKSDKYAKQFEHDSSINQIDRINLFYLI